MQAASSLELPWRRCRLRRSRRALSSAAPEAAEPTPRKPSPTTAQPATSASSSRNDAPRWRSSSVCGLSRPAVGPVRPLLRLQRHRQLRDLCLQRLNPLPRRGPPASPAPRTASSPERQGNGAAATARPAARMPGTFPTWRHGQALSLHGMLRSSRAPAIWRRTPWESLLRARSVASVSSAAASSRRFC